MCITNDIKKSRMPLTNVVLLLVFKEITLIRNRLFLCENNQFIGI